jgi:hypothetical protein
MSRMIRPSWERRGAQLPPVPLELFGMGIADAVDPVPIDLAGQ